MTTKTTPDATTTKLAPTVVSSKGKAKTLATQDGRKRPIVAINEEGKLVVCCRRTAKKHGWEVQEVLYSRTPVETPVVEAPAVKTKPKKGALQKAVEADMNTLLGL